MTNTVLIILGMHRSGTSALTRVCNLLGVPLGNALLEQNAFNVKGFWEHLRVVELHESLLTTLRYTWDDVRDLPENWQHDERIAPHKKELTALIKAHVEETGLWGIKDPRLCRLLPLWQNIFEELGIDARYVVMVRNPYETAASLVSRDGFTEGKGLLLWLKHNLEAERFSRGKPRAFVSYPALLEDWKKQVIRISEGTGLSWPVAPEEAQAAIEEYLDKGLKNHTKTHQTGATPFAEGVAAVWEAFAQACEDNTLDAKACDAVTEALTSWGSGFDAAITDAVSGTGSVYETLEAFKQENVKLKNVLIEFENAHNLQAQAIKQSRDIILDLQEKHKDLERRYNNLLESTSWKITAPLRWAVETARGTKSPTKKAS
jgi:hypothetical protein